jgi:predicted ATPase
LLAAARLVTLTGPGGIGKTRLAQEAARASSARFPDGVAFVDLAPLRDPSFVLPTIARALGVDETGNRPITELVTAAVGERRLLLVLDNFEQLTAAASDLAIILEACTGMTVLATSRVRLRLRREQEYPVLPLALPESAANSDAATLSALSQVAAIALFARRARAARPGFALTDQNIDAVVAICRRLDGLPLAIELAAAQARVLTPAQLLQRLERPLDVLGTTAPDVPDRQRTLRAAIAWSHDLLSRQEQALFRRLGVFAGGWTLEAAATVSHLEGDLDVFEGLASLVDKSLVQWHDTGAEPRFSILETVREFALERLREEDDQGLAIEQAHAGYFLSLVEQAYVELVGAEQRTWLVRLDAEDANIRAALVWSLEHRSTESALRLARALWRYWSARGRLIEGRSWLERALMLPGVAEAPLSVRADAHNALGNLLGDSAEYTRARRHYGEALALRRKLADSDGIAGALNNLGIVATWLGDYDDALARYRESLQMWREQRDAFGMALALSNFADVHLAQGDFDGARQYQEEALRLREQVRDAGGSAYSIYSLGEIARLRGDSAEATRYLTDSLARFEALGEKFGLAYIACSLGDLASQAGNTARAADLLSRSLRTRAEMGDKRGVIECLEALAMAAIRLGEDHIGTRLLGAAWAERETLSCPVPPSTQNEHDRVLAGGRTRLGAATVDALHAEGRRLAPEQALMLAYEIVDRLNARTGAAAPEVMSTTAIPTAVAEAPPKAITVAPPEPRETP